MHRRPWLRWCALSLAVAAMHMWLVGQALPDSFGLGAGDVPVRMEVAFVTELAPAAPPAVAPQAAAPAQRALRPAAAASQPEPEPDLEPEPAPEPEPRPAAPETAVAAAPAPSEPTPSAAAPQAEAPAFEWPPSTRLSYRLTGDFRGPVEGQAQVEWVRSGTRYQVRLDVSVGPSFAPLLSRRVTSEGEVTAEGLRPERFDEETRFIFRDPRRLRVDMSGDTVRLAGGAEVPRPPGLQDTASQFVQLTWLFTMQPELLRAGQVLPIPLAFPRRVQLWQYEVGESETLNTPAGPIAAVHVRPLSGPGPNAASDAQRGGDLVPEAWFAPSLQYLPVRILIRQGGGNYVDLLIERLPQQAAPAK